MNGFIYCLKWFIASRKLRLLAAGAIIVALYWAADWRAVGRALAGLDASYLLIALLMFLPQILISALRWRLLVRPLFAISTGEALRQTLMASAFNLILPSKLGDFSKGSMLPIKNRTQFGIVMMRSVSEKVLDVASLAAMLLIGLAVGWPAWISITLFVLAAFLAWAWCARGEGRTRAIFYSLVLWTLHLVQIDLFLRSAGVFVDWPVAAARLPAAIFAGLAPVSLWGVGTRDAALIWLFRDVASSATMAAVGVLTASRYLIPGLAGLVVGTICGIESTELRGARHGSIVKREVHHA